MWGLTFAGLSPKYPDSMTHKANKASGGFGKNHDSQPFKSAVISDEAEIEALRQATMSMTSSHAPTIGIVGNDDNREETRQFLTPEGCGLLVSAGIKIKMEKGAGIDLSFSDETYASYDVEIVDRIDALGCDIVLSYRPLSISDVKLMRKRAALLCMMGGELFDSTLIDIFLEREITVGAFDNMVSCYDNPIFADIIDEINGRAAVVYAQEALSFLGEGKGVLLGAVGGINPCEVLVIGTGRDVQSACIAAMNAGALVTLMDNDVASLQIAQEICGDRLLTAVIHPHVLYNKVRSADVIILGSCTREFEFPRNLTVAMKESVYCLDLNDVEPSISVPRTVAMALTNVLVNFFQEMLIKNGLDDMIATTPGVQEGIVAYRGCLVDKLVATYTGYKAVDLGVLLATN